MKEDVKLYTVKHIVQQIALLEEHLKEFTQGKEEKFCLDCEIKHILLLSGYAQECIGFTCEPQGLIKDIKKWTDDLAEKITSLKKEDALKVVDQARSFRKELEKQLIEKKSSSHHHFKEV